MKKQIDNQRISLLAACLASRHRQRPSPVADRGLRHGDRGGAD